MKRLVILFLLLSVSSSHSFATQKLADFEGVEFNTNQIFKFNQFKGKIIYIDFWASWCPPCLESLPFMNKLYQKYAAQGFEIIAINIDAEKNDAALFLMRYPISYLNLYDPNGKIGKQLKVTNMPTAFLVDREGHILFKHVGFNHEYAQKLDKAIAQLIKKSQSNKN